MISSGDEQPVVLREALEGGDGLLALERREPLDLLGRHESGGRQARAYDRDVLPRGVADPRCLATSQPRLAGDDAEQPRTELGAVAERAESAERADERRRRRGFREGGHPRDEVGDLERALLVAPHETL